MKIIPILLSFVIGLDIASTFFGGSNQFSVSCVSCTIRSTQACDLEDMRWPAQNAQIVRRFDDYKKDGIELMTAPGAAVVAVQDGIVVASGGGFRRGNMIGIDHGHKIASLYGDLSEILVKPHQKVTKGQIIARAGIGSSPQLYFALMSGNTLFNPLICLPQSQEMPQPAI
jgi:murein DD-endopeptidase MepM/ murein hydrolase activator NlpD